jgi:hypothetical protein
MAKNFNELRAKMSPERREANKKAASLLEVALNEASDTDAAEKLLKAVEDAQGELHSRMRMNAHPKNISIAENKKLSRIVRAVKKAHDDLEEIRVDLDEWIIDYKAASK